jgi:hypothetical protein
MFISKIFIFTKKSIDSMLDLSIYLTGKVDNCIIISYNSVCCCCKINTNTEYDKIENVCINDEHIRIPKSRIPILDKFYFVSKNDMY